jgi:uncharacterized membrane protein
MTNAMASAAAKGMVEAPTTGQTSDAPAQSADNTVQETHTPLSSAAQIETLLPTWIWLVAGLIALSLGLVFGLAVFKRRQDKA